MRDRKTLATHSNSLVDVLHQGWPDEDVDGFRNAMMTLFDSSVKLSNTVLSLMAIGLQLRVGLQ